MRSVKTGDFFPTTLSTPFLRDESLASRGEPVSPPVRYGTVQALYFGIADWSMIDTRGRRQLYSNTPSRLYRSTTHAPPRLGFDGETQVLARKNPNAFSGNRGRVRSILVEVPQT